MEPQSTISKAALPDLFAARGPTFGQRVRIALTPEVRREPSDPGSADFSVSVACDAERWEFAAEAKTRSTPRVVDDALRQAQRRAAASGRFPMVIVPFLGEKRIDELEDEGVSGLDLCGNGLILVPGRLLLRRTGQPNRYPESRPARFAYRGATSLVPRVFLRRAEYQSVSQIRDEIGSAGGNVALSTVSKALARMADDLIIERSEGRIALMQPEKLLDALVQNYTTPKPERTLQLKTPVGLQDFCRRAEAVAESAPRLRTVLSGASSQSRYAAGLRTDTPILYADNLAELKRRAGEAWKPVDRFADLTVVETRDPTPFFDARQGEDGVRFASPVQAYLELNAGGEKRDSEMATQVRARVLQNIGG